MSDRPDAEARPTTDVAGELLAALEDDATLVDAGRFTFDVTRARSKLANDRLADPQSFVVLLVAAAHVLPSCTKLVFELGRRVTRVVFEGATLSAHELSTLFDAVFEDLGENDRVRARRYLAVALGAVLEDPHARARLTTAGLRSRYTSSGSSAVEQVDHPTTVSSLELVITERSPWTFELSGASRGGRRRELLRTRCLYSRVPVIVDGVRLNHGPTPPTVGETLELRDDGRAVA